MSNVVPGYSWLGSTDPITASKLNLTAQPTVSLGTNEVSLANLATLSSNNQLLGRSTTSSGNVEAINLLTTGLGFYTGAGGTVTQATNKSTGVTLNTMCGQIVMNNANLGATTSVGFTFTNSKIATTDFVGVVIDSVATADSYTVMVDAVGTGSCRISLRNYTAGGLGEAIVLNFVVIKSVIA